MRTKSFFLALLSFASLTASAQQSETQTTDSLVKAAYFVDGKYYSKELPTDAAAAQSMGFVSLSKDYKHHPSQGSYCAPVVGQV